MKPVKKKGEKAPIKEWPVHLVTLFDDEINKETNGLHSGENTKIVLNLIKGAVWEINY